MRNLYRLGFPLIALAVAGFATPIRARCAELGPETDYVSIETPAGGVPMLVVRYPWTTHKKPSIEVRTYLPGEEESARIRPLFFRHVFMKGTVTIGVYETQAGASEIETLAEFTERGVDFLAIGQRNVLGRPAVCVTCETDPLGPKPIVIPSGESESTDKTNQAPKGKAKISQRIRWAVFPFAEPWAADERTLFLSLPDATFAAPAKIRVFFLRDDDVVWAETKQWPGLESDKAAQAPVANANPTTTP